MPRWSIDAVGRLHPFTVAALAVLSVAVTVCAEAEAGNPFGKQFGFGPSLRRAGASAAAICGDGVIAGMETCDDGGTTAGDGCSATCAIESPWLCSGAPSVCSPISSRAMSLGNGQGNDLSCGNVAALSGATDFKFALKFRSQADINICSAGGAAIAGQLTSATDGSFDVRCIDDSSGPGEELRVRVTNGTTITSCNRTDLDMLGRQYEFVGCHYNGSATMNCYLLGPNLLSNTEVAMTCTPPASLDGSVTAQLLFSASGGMTTTDLDEFVLWVGDGSGPEGLAEWQAFYGSLTGYEGEWIDPRNTDGADPVRWYRFGELSGDGTTAVNVITVANSTLYRYTVDTINVDFTSDASATATEIRDGLIAAHTTAAAANPTLRIGSTAATIFDSDTLSISNGSQDARFYITETDTRLTTTAAAVDVMGGTTCTGGMSSGWPTVDSDGIRIVSRINRDRFGSDYRSFTVTDGSELPLNISGGVRSNEYIQQPFCSRYGYRSLRCDYNHGSNYNTVESREQYGVSLDNAVDWFWALGVDYPWSPVVELTVEPSQAPTLTNFTGSILPGVSYIHTQHDSQEGNEVVCFDQTYSSGEPHRMTCALRSDRQNNTATWTPDCDGACGNNVTFFKTSAANANTSWNRTTGFGVDLPNGDMVMPLFGADTSGACSSGPYQQGRWRSTGTHGVDESWETGREELEINGCAYSGGNFAPGFATYLRFRQAPGDSATSHHGRIYKLVKATTAPPGGSQHALACLYTDDPATDPSDTTWTWRNCSDGSSTTNTSGINWSTGLFMGLGYAPILMQLTDGVLATVSVSSDGNQNLLYYSTDFGATWNSLAVGPNNTGSPSQPLSPGSRGGSIYEISANRPQVMEAHGTTIDRLNVMVAHDLADATIPAGPLSYSDGGWCEVNGDLAEANEYLRGGVLPDLQGRARNTFAFLFRDNDGGAQETIFAQWGLTGGDQSFRISRLTGGAVRLELGGYLCETAGSVLTTGVTHEIAIRYNGGTPSLLIDVNGGNVVCNVNVTGTVPSTWPASTARTRWGIDYNDTLACTNCFFDEITAYAGIVAVDAARGAACLGTDMRLCDVDDDADNDGTVNASDTDDDDDRTPDSTDTDDDGDGILDASDSAGVTDVPLFYARCDARNASLSAANGCAQIETEGYAPINLEGINTECTDTGVTP